MVYYNFIVMYLVIVRYLLDDVELEFGGCFCIRFFLGDFDVIRRRGC